MTERSPQQIDVRVIVPALNEAQSLPSLLQRMPAFVSSVLVVDNDSSDDTSAVATACGARVVHEVRRGYGAACLKGIEHIGACDIIVFVDADTGDAVQHMAELVAPILKGEADFVLSTRMGSPALSPQQRFGNSLACLLMRWLWGASYTDLGPFRAITPAALQGLQMRDRGHGWTVEMQIKAQFAALRTVEIPLPYRDRRHGRSKISGTVAGVFKAGARILFVIAREAIRGRPRTVRGPAQRSIAVPRRR
jgi:glycosyltransferase involved in cell wall biosynthesis